MIDIAEPGPARTRPVQLSHDSELDRLREENRRLAVTLGGFSAFIAAKGMLEEAWNFVHSIHEMDEQGG